MDDKASEKRRRNIGRDLEKLERLLRADSLPPKLTIHIHSMWQRLTGDDPAVMDDLAREALASTVAAGVSAIRAEGDRKRSKADRDAEIVRYIDERDAARGTFQNAAFTFGLSPARVSTIYKKHKKVSSGPDET